MAKRTVLDNDLKLIHESILELSSLVLQAVRDNFDDFKKYAPNSLEEAKLRDDVIDALHRSIENRVVTTIALQQPAASDLRELIADLFLATELERMGDYAESIAVITHEEQGDDEHRLIPDPLVSLMDQSQRLVNNAVHAYVERDADSARTTAQQDDTLDKLYKTARGSILNLIANNEVTLEWGVHLFWIAHWAERLGDRGTNICERVIYMETGRTEELNL